MTVTAFAGSLCGWADDTFCLLTGNLEWRCEFCRIEYGGGVGLDDSSSVVCSTMVAVGWWACAGVAGLVGVGMLSMVSVLGRRYLADGSVSK